jgi:hypothetical protein
VLAPVSGLPSPSAKAEVDRCALSRRCYYDAVHLDLLPRYGCAEIDKAIAPLLRPPSSANETRPRKSLTLDSNLCER